MPHSGPIVVSGEPGGLVDFICRLEKLVPTDSGWFGLFASGTHQGKQADFRIMIAPGLRPGFVNDKPDESAFKEGGILIEADGRSGDQWVRCVAEGWGMKGAGLRLAQQVAFTSFATHGTPQNFRKEEVRFKLLVGSEDGGDYAEWFLHLNVPKGYAGFAEKDARYRANILLALTGFRG